jgi:branched-chain amino acid transport system permease protein
MLGRDVWRKEQEGEGQERERITWEAVYRRLLNLVKGNRVLLAFSAFLGLLPLWAAPLAKPLHLNIVATMQMVGIFTIAAVGLNLLIGYAGQISLGHSAFFGVGAYTSAILAVRAHFPVWLAIIMAIGASALLGLLVAPILRLKGHYLAMATLGLGFIAFVFMREMTGLTGGNVGIRDIPNLSIPGLSVTSDKGEYYMIWIIAVIILALCANLVSSRVGRAIRALHQSDVAASAMGINVSWEKIKVFMLSAALGGLAGGLYAHLQGYIDPNLFYITLSIQLVAMVVVGGMESIWGAVAGAGLLTFLPKVVEALPKWFGPGVPGWLANYSNYEGLVFGLILILTMIFMPWGITRGLSDFARYRRSPFINPFRKKVVE